MRELFEGWVRDHHAAVWRSAWGIVRDADDASEITQEVFLQVLRRPDEVARADHPQRLLRWRAVKGALARLRGERNRRRREEETAMQRPEPFAPESPEQRELAAALRGSLDALPEELRLATLLRFREELTFAQVGECLGVAEATAFERVKRALEKLRTRLAQLGHAGALAQLEPWLAAPASVAVPAGLASQLLALTTGAAAAGAGAAAAATAAGATAAGAKPLLALAAGIVLLIGGIFGVRALRHPAADSASSIASASAPATAPPDGAGARSGEGAVPTAAPTRVDEAAAHPTPTPASPSTTPTTRPAADFLGTDFPLPPGAVDAARRVATGSLAGVIVDDDGRAVAGAMVEAQSSEGASKGFQWRGEAVTGADGAFTLELAVVVEGGQHYTLATAHDDFLAHRTPPFTVAAAERTDLGRVALRRNSADRAGEFELALVVLDPAGRPVEGAFARLHRAIETRDGAEPAAALPLAAIGPWEAGGATDATGTARLRGTRIGKKQLVIDATRLGYRLLQQPIAVEWTGFQERRVTLETGLVLAGRLVFPAGCDVAKESLGAEVPVDEPSADGEGAVRAALQRVTTAGGAGGMVREPGAQVYAIGADPAEWLHATLAADGSFRIVGLVPGRYTLHVRSHFSPAALFDVDAGREDLVIPLKRRDDVEDSGVHLAELHGRVVDAASGAPLAAPWDAIEVVRIDDGASGSAASDDDASLRDDLLPTLASPRMVQTMMEMGFRPPPPSADFHVTGLDAGRYVAVARVSGFAPGFSRPIALARQALVKDVVVTLQRPAGVAGIVVDADGQPIAHAIVFAIGAGPRSQLLLATMDESVRAQGGEQGVFLGNTASTDAHGRFELAGLPPGLALVIAAVHPRFAPATRAAPELAPGSKADAGTLRLARRE